MPHVVTCFVRNRAEVLLVRRSDAVETYPGQWGGVSGYVEGEPADALCDARRELREEVGLTDADVTLVRTGDPLTVRDGERAWVVHPFLFESTTRTATPTEELAAVQWVPPTTIRSRETVPNLWEAYRRVAPTVETVRTDTDHGSTYVSVRALEVLRDAAGEASDWATVAEVARALREARPSMAAVATRVDAVLAGTARTPDAVHDAALDALERALDADAAASENAADRLREGGVGRVATLSRSGTVETALRRVRPAVVVGESRPGGEGVGVAERLAREGLDVTLTTDATLPTLLAGGDDLGLDAPPVDAVLVGADAVLADGSVVNKVGTRSIALAAERAGISVYVVAAGAKVRPDESMFGEISDAPVGPERKTESEPALDGTGAATYAVCNPVFERVPEPLVTAVVTESGTLDAASITKLAATHRANAAWVDDV